MKSAATGVAAAAFPSALDVRDFNAVGDGKTDNTSAIQKALNKAAKTKNTVFIPDGVFVCSTLKMPPFTGLCGNPTWGYRDYAGSILRLGDPTAKCLIDITGALVSDSTACALMVQNWAKEFTASCWISPITVSKRDTVCIERCRIGNFTGDGLHLSRIWVFSIRPQHGWL